jgi:hypothetical protein
MVPLPSTARSSRFAAAWVVALGVGACTGVRQHADTGSTGAGGLGGQGAAGSGVGGSLYTDASAPDLYVGGLPDVGPIERVVGSAPLGDAACATHTQKAERLPLDLYVMLDSSDSMTDLTANLQTKWDAVTAALTAFVRDPSSAGLGVGLQYFPITKPGAPVVCTTNAMCGANGPCDTKVCTNSNRVEFCQADAECGAGGTCAQIGLCSLTPDYFCTNLGGYCGAGTRGTPRNNTCVPPQYSCRREICDGATYAAPAVEVAPLPGAANALVASLSTHMTDGLTPTSGALSGAIAHAQALAKANPTHQEVVVMATDGFPSECVPLDIPGIAAIAAKGLAGPPSVSTFVIGVFTPEEAADAQTNLDAIATAGGTKKAFVINTNQNVEQQFVAALNAVRTAALSCEYKVPMAAAGETLDYYSVNVQYTSGAGQAVTIGNVPSKAACDPRKGGWYYDVDPSKGVPPTNISICDTTCTQLRADSAGRVDVLLGCKTEIVVP